MLIGQIPSQIASLKNLQRLILDNNILKGPIPSWVGGMTSIMQLWLGGNQLTGAEMTLVFIIYCKIAKFKIKYIAIWFFYFLF